MLHNAYSIETTPKRKAQMSVMELEMKDLVIVDKSLADEIKDESMIKSMKTINCISVTTQETTTDHCPIFAV